MASRVIPQSPFPYFGGKSSIAECVWERFGKVDNYIEPFCGSAAVLLADPNSTQNRVINDADGFVSNFWRSLVNAPDEVAKHCDWPVNESDLFARHIWLVNHREQMTNSLLSDPEWYDAKIAGWWVWGLCNWIGSEWCTGNGRWNVVDGQIAKVGREDLGVNRTIPEMFTMGRGVLRQIMNSTVEDSTERYSQHLKSYLKSVKDCMRRVKVACGDWRRVLTPTVLGRPGNFAIFMDPPYGEGAMEYAAGGNDDKNIALDAWTWAVENGNDPRFRIAVCAYLDDRHVPSDWTVVNWKAPRGYQTAENDRSAEEVIYFSPYCLKPENIKQLDMFEQND